MWQIKGPVVCAGSLTFIWNCSYRAADTMLVYLVFKVSKLGKLKCKSDSDSVQDVKADDLRQMFLAMTQEVLCA